jgi:hypothetical protein
MSEVGMEALKKVFDKKSLHDNSLNIEDVRVLT